MESERRQEIERNFILRLFLLSKSGAGAEPFAFWFQSLYSVPALCCIYCRWPQSAVLTSWLWIAGSQLLLDLPTDWNWPNISIEWSKDKSVLQIGRKCHQPSDTVPVWLIGADECFDFWKIVGNRLFLMFWLVNFTWLYCIFLGLWQFVCDCLFLCYWVHSFWNLRSLYYCLYGKLFSPLKCVKHLKPRSSIDIFRPHYETKEKVVIIVSAVQNVWFSMRIVEKFQLGLYHSCFSIGPIDAKTVTLTKTYLRNPNMNANNVCRYPCAHESIRLHSRIVEVLDHQSPNHQSPIGSPESKCMAQDSAQLPGKKAKVLRV